MFPSDLFVRFYNEVFKALDAKGRKHLSAYWHELGKLQCKALGELFRKGGVRAAREYWERIIREENCRAEIIDHGEWFEFIMKRCPSLSKAQDNDAAPFELYCDHCMAWAEPVMKHAGLHAAMDMVSRQKPVCRFAVCASKVQAETFARKAKLASTPYKSRSLPPRKKTSRKIPRASVKG